MVETFCAICTVTGYPCLLFANVLNFSFVFKAYKFEFMAASFLKVACAEVFLG